MAHAVKGRKSFCEAAYEILKRENRPMSPREICDLAIKRRLIVTNSERPSGTMAARLWKSKRFESIGSGKWIIRGSKSALGDNIGTP